MAQQLRINAFESPHLDQSHNEHVRAGLRFVLSGIIDMPDQEQRDDAMREACRALLRDCGVYDANGCPLCLG